MSWVQVYQVMLRLLPRALRDKHGAAMGDLFARELAHARAQGWFSAARAGVVGISDVLWRSAYEYLRPNHAPITEPDPKRAMQPTRLDAPSSVALLSHSPMPIPSNRELLRRHALSFAWAFVALTLLLVTLFGIRQGATLSERGAPPGSLVLALILALPFTAAMTIPMAVLIAVVSQFFRLRAEGTVDAARQVQGGLRRLVLPVLGAAAVVSFVALVITAGVVPHTNAQLATLLSGREGGKNDRTMTMGELRTAERTSRARGDVASERQAAAFELEFHKKLALPAACVVLALVGMALALRLPRGGVWMVVLVNVGVLGLYYVMIMAGESLADRMIVSPVVAMWGANAVLVLMAWLASVGQPRGPSVVRSGAVAIGR